ncbi:unnamed protein product [Cyclocybe aegerita]|uniref:Fumarate lyase N-terminal domain-containing protein n=1 Tax=Cyclocybe aegerita TaxID=1973307 RepID=A0A8S0X0F5_CYCAE|nr:unnamed protein product [Cyclocybe aegerita]
MVGSLAYAHYLQFEASLAAAQARAGIIPQEAADVIAAQTIETIDMEELAEETKAIGYPVLPLVKQLARCTRDEGHHRRPARDLSDKYADTPMTARSNLQQAVPMTFGFKMARLLATFMRHEQRLSQLLSRLLVVEFGGAAGTLATIAEYGFEVALQVQAGVAEGLGLSRPEIAWHTERDWIAEVGAFFALLTGTCAKFALDVKLLMQTEVGEVYEPYAPHRGSSSTMQKRKPISSVYITAMASTVKQLSAALFEALVEDHGRSTGP